MSGEQTLQSGNSAVSNPTTALRQEISFLDCASPAARAEFLNLTSHPPCLYRETPDLQGKLFAAGLQRTAGLEPDSLEALFKQFLCSTALPNSMMIIESKDGGETTVKTNQIGLAVQEALGGKTHDLAGRVFHLMCYAGKDTKDNPVLLNLLRPVVGNTATTDLLMKTGQGGADTHLVLNKTTAALLLGGFQPLEEQDLGPITGMQRHAVNFMLKPERFDQQPDLRCVFDPALFKNYLGSPDYQVNFVEVPFGSRAGSYSIVMPVEVLLAFAVKSKTDFPHIEIASPQSATLDTLPEAMKVMRELLSLPSLEKILQYNGKRPLMSSFNAFIGQLTKEFTTRAPFISKDAAQRAVGNFVRHFFAVEFNLVKTALETREPAALETCYTKLAATEFGKFIVPLTSFASFSAKITEEQAKKQPPLPFENSTEVSKSDTYLRMLEKIAGKLEHALQSTLRKNPAPGQIFTELQQQLELVCNPGKNQEIAPSVKNTVTDFINMLFEPHQILLSKIQNKLSGLLDPEQSKDPLTKDYWTHYWQSTRQMCHDLNLSNVANSPILLAERAIAPDLLLLYKLPFAHSLFGAQSRLVDGLIAQAASQ